MRATDCVWTELPSYGDRVGVARATALLNECIYREGPSCADACDESADTRAACDALVDMVPRYADLDRVCLVELTVCLDECQEANPHARGEEGFLASGQCLGAGTTGHGSCPDYVAGLTECGGSGYSVDTKEACEARCDEGEGAWDKGPFDSCYDACEGVDVDQQDLDAFIRRVAADVGEETATERSSIYFRATAAEELPRVVTHAAEVAIADGNTRAEQDGLDLTLELDEDALMGIVNDDEQLVGYMIGIYYTSGDQDFEGGGLNVYVNLLGETLESIEWLF